MCSFVDSQWVGGEGGGGGGGLVMVGGTNLGWGGGGLVLHLVWFNLRICGNNAYTHHTRSRQQIQFTSTSSLASSVHDGLLLIVQCKTLMTHTKSIMYWSSKMHKYIYLHRQFLELWSWWKKEDQHVFSFKSVAHKLHQLNVFVQWSYD